MLGLALVLSGFGQMMTSKYGLGDGREGALGVKWLVKGVGRAWSGLEADHQ